MLKEKYKLSEVARSCPTLCDPMDCSLPGSSLHGVLQARVPEWVAISFSRVSSRPGIEPVSPALSLGGPKCGGGSSRCTGGKEEMGWPTLGFVSDVTDEGSAFMEKVFQRVLPIGVTFPTPRSGHDTNSFLAAPVDVLQWFLLLGNLQGEWPARHSLVSRQHPLVVKRLREARRF